MNSLEETFSIGWVDVASHLSPLIEPLWTVFFGFLTATVYMLLTRKILAPRIRIIDVIDPNAGPYTDSKYRFRVKNAGRWKIIDNRFQVRLLVHKKGTPLHWFNTEVRHDVPLMRAKSTRRFAIGNIEANDWKVLSRKYGFERNSLPDIVARLKSDGYRVELHLFWYGVDSLSGVLKLQEFDDLLACPRFVPKVKSIVPAAEEAEEVFNSDEDSVVDDIASERDAAPAGSS